MTRHPHVSLPFRGKTTPSGRRRCGLCGEQVGKGRRDWCSENCISRFRIAKGDQGAARWWLWQVDLGVCQLCGVDTVGSGDLPCDIYTGLPIDRRLCGQAGQWEADHWVPICEGGDLSPENLRTLCIACHRAETRALSGRRAARRSGTAIKPLAEQCLAGAAVQQQ